MGGTPEMLGYGAAGRLVSPGAPQQLAVELRKLMADPAERLALRRAARDGSEVFDVKRLIQDYGQVYREAANG